LISWWALLLLSLGYVSILFAIAYWGDKTDPKRFSGTARATIYGLRSETLFGHGAGDDLRLDVGGLLHFLDLLRRGG